MKTKTKKRKEKAPAGSSGASGSALGALCVGEWPAETAWERAERARVFLRVMGYATDVEVVSIGKRIRQAGKSA